MITKYINAAGFVLILICFLFPLISIKCNEMEIVSFKGTDLVFGKNYNPSVPENTESTAQDNERDEAGNKPINHMGSNPAIVAALIAALAGLVLSLALTKRNSIAAISCAVAILVSLLIFVVRLESDITKQAKDPMLSMKVFVSYEAGFWLMIVFALGIIFYNMYKLFQRSRLNDIGPVM